MRYTKLLGFFQAFYKQTGYLFPIFVLAPNYFKGQITLGTMLQIVQALGYVKSAFDWFIDTYPTLANFRGTTDRLQNFLDRMELKDDAARTISCLTELPLGAESDAAVIA